MPGSGISAKVFSGAEKMQGKPCLTTGRRATARCIMKGHRTRDRRHDGMGEPTVATGKHGYVFRCGSPIFKLSFKNRFSSLPLRQFSQMLYAVAAA